MQTKPKANSVVSSRVREDGAVEITVLGAGPLSEGGQPTNATLVVDPKAMSEGNRLRAMRMGIVSRVVDKAALPFVKAENRYATPQEKLAAMAPIVAHLNSGAESWSPERAVTSKRATAPALDPLLIAAVAEGTGRAFQTVVEMVGKGSGAKGVTPAVYLAALAQAGKIAPIVERMRAEEAGKVELSGDELLGEMGEEGGE